MESNNASQQPDLGEFACNAYGQRYLASINRDVFKSTEASHVFYSYFGDSLFEEDTFHIIAGTDSGLLYQYVKTHGIPKGSHYLFVEIPEVLSRLNYSSDTDSSICITTYDNWLSQAKKLNAQNYFLLERLRIHRSLGVIHGHYNAYAPFWRAIHQEFNEFCRQITIAHTETIFSDCQLKNLTENLVPAICLRNSFRGKTAVILAGGPSLDGILPWVKQNRRNLLVIAVSRISRSLIQSGIQPDICVSVDPQDINLRISFDMLEFQNGTLLVNEYHLCPHLLASWGGPKVYMGTRYPWSTPLEPDNIPTSIGTTVTNSAFAIAKEMGVSQIVLGGADFCFGHKGVTHASGMTEHQQGPRFTQSHKQVKTNSGMVADTSTDYYDSAICIDTQAKEALGVGCKTINPAPGAMRLPHVDHIQPDEIHIEPLEQPAHDILNEYVPQLNGVDRIHIYKEALGEVDRMVNELIEVSRLSRKALSYNRKVLTESYYNSNSPSQGFNSNLAKKVDHIDVTITKKHAGALELIKQFHGGRFIQMLGLDAGRLEDLVKNSQLYFEALKDICSELVDTLRTTRQRILCRLEEEKPDPSFEYLLTQWQRDNQPGHAIQWAKKHRDYINRLPTEHQLAFQNFQDSFDIIVKRLGELHDELLKDVLKFDSVAAKAQESFHCGDENELQRISSALSNHPDQNSTKDLVRLVQGYLAELRKDMESAFESYSKVLEEQPRVYALMRLFELHSNINNWDKALEVLKSLSDMNIDYVPMYADLLFATGEIDTAVNVYTDYVLSHPDDLDSMMKLGKIFQQQGVVEGVNLTMNHILGKDPNNKIALAILAEMGLSPSNTETSNNAI